MKKSVSRLLYLLALLLVIIAVAVFIYGAVGTNFSNLNSLMASGQLFVPAAMNNPMFTALGVLIYLVGALLALIAWIGALVKTARLGRWGWFVCLLVLSGITMLIYIFAGPTTSARQNMG